MRRKLAAVGAAYLIGLIFASIFIKFAIFLICGVILLVLSAVTVALIPKKYDITAVLLCCAIGIAVYFAVSSQLDKAAEPLLGGTYDISATVTSKKTTGTGSAIFTLESNTENGKVGILLYSDDINAEKGDTLRFDAELSKLYNTAAYAIADRYRSDGITLSATLKSDITVTKGSYPLSFIDNYRSYLISKIDAEFSDDSGRCSPYSSIRYALNAYYDDTYSSVIRIGRSKGISSALFANNTADAVLYDLFRIYTIGYEKRNNDHHIEYRCGFLPKERLHNLCRSCGAGYNAF